MKDKPGAELTMIEVLVFYRLLLVWKARCSHYKSGNTLLVIGSRFMKLLM